MDNSIAIKLMNISKVYTIHHEKPTLVEKFIKGKEEHFTALHNINLTIKEGERVGIIGPNGSGKTTLLKIIASITTPTSGKMITNGKVVSLIDLEAGFHPDLSGYQNIFINGMLLGMSKWEIYKKIKYIIQFADIGQFIDTPLFTYSEGMKLRLGFSIAVHSDPDIVILDENLSTGDLDFQYKSMDRIKKLIKEKNVTVVYVSQNIYFLRMLCKKIIWLHNRKIFKVGDTSLLSKYAQCFN